MVCNLVSNAIGFSWNMARTRPPGRTKSDHWVRQAARHACPADDRDCITISAEKQEALIAAVNTRGEAEPTLCHRRRQEFEGVQAACGSSPFRPEGEPMLGHAQVASKRPSLEDPSLDACAAQGVSPTHSPQAALDNSQDDAFSFSTIRALVRAALTGSPNDSKRGQRVFRKHAGTVCRRAREEAGPAGLLWSRAAWEGSLHAAKTGLEWLAETSEVVLLDGFKEVLAATKRAHLEGLEQPASASSRPRHAAREKTAGMARSPAGNPRKRAAQRSARSLGKPADQDDLHTLQCNKCGATAEFALRGSKEGGQVKYFCAEHGGSNGCFRVDRDRAAWAQNQADLRKLRAEVARLGKELRQMGGGSPAPEHTCSQSACHEPWQSEPYWDTSPKPRCLLVKLLMIGGVESNPGPASDEMSPDRASPAAPGGPIPEDDVSAARAAPQLPSLEDLIAEALEEAREKDGAGDGGERLLKSTDKASRRRSRRIDDDPEEEGPQSLQRRRVVFLEDDDEEDGGEVPTAPPPSTAEGREAEPTQPPASAAGGSGMVGGQKRSSDWRSPMVNSRAGAKPRSGAPREAGSEPFQLDAAHGQAPNPTAAGEEAEELTPAGTLEAEPTPADRLEEEPVPPDEEDRGRPVERSAEERAAQRMSTSVGPGAHKGKHAAKKKRKKKAQPAANVDREAAAEAVASHRRTLESLTRVAGVATVSAAGQGAGQPPRHQTDMRDFAPLPPTTPTPLVTAAPIPNVGELHIRVQEKWAADAAAAQAERLKVYGRQRPLGQHTRPVGNEQPVADQAPSEPLSNPNQSPQSPQPTQPLAPSDQPSACAIEEPSAADDQPNSPGQFPTEPSSQPSSQPSAPDAPLSLPALEDEPGAPDQPGLPVDQPTIGGGMRDGRPGGASDQPGPALGEPVAAGLEQPSTGDERPAADKPDPPDQPNQPDQSEAEEMGPCDARWCSKLVAALEHMQANGHKIAVAKDVHAAGAKSFSSFKDLESLVAYRKQLGSRAFLNEVILDEACWRIYFDFDYKGAAEDPDDFSRRLASFHQVRDQFLSSVLHVSPAAASFQSSEAHGPIPSGSGFKYSVHEVLRGYHLKGLEARRAFGKAFESFLNDPPDDLKVSVELLRKDGGSDYLWDASVYSKNRCFRMLHSSKLGDPFRSLVPSEGSSPKLADHLVCLYSEEELLISTELDDAGLLNPWASPQTAAPAAPVPTSRQGAFRERALDIDEASTSRGLEEGLSEQEERILLGRYQEDHPGAEVDRVVQERPGLFFVHFRAPEPTCCIAGRRHSSLGNQNPYLIYKRNEPRVARYQCFANSCRGECRVLPLDMQTIFGWTEDYEDNMRMQPYPVFGLERVQKRTILVSAKKGVGKSKAFIKWLIEMVKKNPELSFILIGANISLSRKYYQDLVDAGIEGVVLYQEAPPGKIEAARVVCCINSIHRVRAGMDIVGMDEMDMVLTNLNSEVMSKRKQVLSCLEADVASARVVIGMDANIDCARVMEYLFMVRPDAALYTIRNTGLYPASRRATIRIFPPESSMLACVDTAARDVLDRVARGVKVVSPSTTKRYVKHLEHFFLEENKPSKSDRQGIFLHADKKSKEDEDFFRRAMADPDKYLEADCVAFSPKLGPGVSKERAYAEETVAFALNSLHGPTVETLLQQHARFRTVTDSTIYYKQIVSPVVDLPKTTEHVFLAIERDDKQLAKMLGDVASLDFLEGSRAVCDRSSASCVLYANNILAKVESYIQYIPKLKADLERQGFQVSIEYIEPQVKGAPPSEIPPGFDEGDNLISDEAWREKYVITSGAYVELVEKDEDPREDLDERQKVQKYLYEMIRFYKVDPRRVDHAFYGLYCADSEDVKATKQQYVNYLIFRGNRFDDLAMGLDTALLKADREGVTQEYVKEVRKPENRVLFAVRVLASLQGCNEPELDHEAERWEVSEERVQAAYVKYIGVSEQRRKTIFNMYNFVQQTKRASKSKNGKESKHWGQKRNAVLNVLFAGLGIRMEERGRKSNGIYRSPHVLTPGPWKEVHSRYGVLPERQFDRSEEVCMIVPR